MERVDKLNKYISEIRDLSNDMTNEVVNIYRTLFKRLRVEKPQTKDTIDSIYDSEGESSVKRLFSLYQEDNLDNVNVIQSKKVENIPQSPTDPIQNEIDMITKYIDTIEITKANSQSKEEVTEKMDYEENDGSKDSENEYFDSNDETVESKEEMEITKQTSKVNEAITMIKEQVNKAKCMVEEKWNRINTINISY